MNKRSKSFEKVTFVVGALVTYIGIMVLVTYLDPLFGTGYHRASLLGQMELLAFWVIFFLSVSILIVLVKRTLRVDLMKRNLLPMILLSIVCGTGSSIVIAINTSVNVALAVSTILVLALIVGFLFFDV